MAIARTLKHYLDEHHVRYDTVTHTPTETAVDSARSAHVPVHQVAKAVVLEDDSGYVVSIVPSNNRLNLEWVKEELQRDLHLATEPELGNLFDDCDIGAVPALTQAYGLDAIWDDHLKHVSDVYIEGGDHQHLVHLSGEDFRQLMRRLPHSIISASEDYSSWMYE
ncbi:aminoacyl-tRNA deacylase [Elongatibacter sediminis]|uniref:YbaK/EbsC family protein n=1 Tax=Elongatibacter sediminis TaxID=3119006 RepID=A0AAW9RGW7_9GAMM